MTREEFVNLSGLTEITEAEYKNKIEPLYYGAKGNLYDKKPFSEAIAKIWDNPLFQQIVDSHLLRCNVLDIYKREQAEDAELMLSEGFIMNDKKLLDRAQLRIGHPGVIKTKIAKGYELSQEDMDYIVENLK